MAHLRRIGIPSAVSHYWVEDLHEAVESGLVSAVLLGGCGSYRVGCCGPWVGWSGFRIHGRLVWRLRRTATGCTRLMILNIFGCWRELLAATRQSPALLGVGRGFVGFGAYGIFGM